MFSKFIVTAALFTVGTLTFATSAHANTLSGLSNLSSYTLHDPDGETGLSGNMAYFAAVGQKRKSYDDGQRCCRWRCDVELLS